MRRAAPVSAAAAGALAVLAVAGCSGTPADHKASEVAEVGKVARAYQTAVNGLDWRRACELRTPALRHGTVAKCAAVNVGPEKSPTPTPTPSASASDDPSATPTGEPTAPTYGDGRTLPPPATRTASPGPDRARTGPVKTGRPVKVAASADHPAGYGVIASYTVTWPGKTTTARIALRLVKTGGAWRVDQREDVQQGDYQTGDALRAALSK